MKDFDLFKPIRPEIFAKLLVQVTIGIAVILVLASCIEPVEISDSYPDPFYIRAISERIYDSMMLVATESAKLVVPIALLYGVSTMGYIGKKVAEFVGERLLILIQMIEEKRKEENTQSVS